MYFTTKLIAQGTDAEVWLLNDERLVAKIFYHHHNMKHEAGVMKELYGHKGINLPKPIGIQKVVVTRIKKRLLRKDLLIEQEEEALVMQRIEGRDIREFRGNTRIIDEFRKQVNACIALGWYPGDANIMNGLVDRSGKVFLIDFSGWMKYNKEDLEEMQKAGWFRNFSLSS